jgi:hypothetical protein
MLKGYNLAFMPINYSKKFVQFAHDTAKGVKVGDYLLGPISLPHVSICHFIMDDVDIENIWHQVQALKLPTLSLSFSKIRAKIYPPDAYCNVTQSAVSLIPNNTDILTTTHIKIVEIIHNPLNASFSNYDPHLTLFNSYDIDGCKHFNHAPIIQPLLDDDFLIALGHIDLIGQVTDILFMS